MERDGVYGDDDALVAVPSVTADVFSLVAEPWAHRAHRLLATSLPRR